MKTKICCVLILLMVLSLLAGCSQREILLLDNDHLTITRTGAETTITDKLSGEVYTLHSVHKRHTEAKTKPYTAVDTPTIKIIIIPGGFEVVSGKTSYTFTIRRF